MEVCSHVLLLLRQVGELCMRWHHFSLSNILWWLYIGESAIGTKILALPHSRRDLSHNSAENNQHFQGLSKSFTGLGIAGGVTAWPRHFRPARLCGPSISHGCPLLRLLRPGNFTSLPDVSLSRSWFPDLWNPISLCAIHILFLFHFAFCNHFTSSAASFTWCAASFAPFVIFSLHLLSCLYSYSCSSMSLRYM